jgi:hypothetical protein
MLSGSSDLGLYIEGFREDFLVIPHNLVCRTVLRKEECGRMGEILRAEVYRSSRNTIANARPPRIKGSLRQTDDNG